MKQTISRKQLLGLGAVAVAATAAARATPAGAHARVHGAATESRLFQGIPQPVDRQFRRSSPPNVEVRYPNNWYLYERLLPRLLSPEQIFWISNYQLDDSIADRATEHPDVGRLPRDAVLVLLLSEQFPPDAEHAPTVPASEGVRLGNVVTRDDGPPGFEWLFQWYESEEFIYTFLLWVGKDGGDGATGEALMETIHLP